VSALVRLICDCGYGACEVTIAIAAQTTTDARASAKLEGWDCDVIGGTTVDWAPGHELDLEGLQ